MMKNHMKMGRQSLDLIKAKLKLPWPGLIKGNPGNHNRSLFTIIFFNGTFHNQTLMKGARKIPHGL